MLMEYLVSAFILGFVVAIPPGSVTVVACQIALQYGFRSSLFFSIGSRLSDAFYLILVYIGIARLVADNPSLKTGLWIICGFLLIGIGLNSILSLHRIKRSDQTNTELPNTPMALFLSGVLITITNPLTILAWTAIGGNFFLIWNSKYPASHEYGWLAITIIVLGVLSWFVPLTWLISRLKHLLSDRFRNWLLIGSNGILILFGLMAFYHASGYAPL